MTLQTASSSCVVSTCTWPGGLGNSFARTESLQGADALSPSLPGTACRDKETVGNVSCFLSWSFFWRNLQGLPELPTSRAAAVQKIGELSLFLPEIKMAFNTFCDYLVGMLRKNFQKVGRCQSSATKENVCGEHSTSSRWKSYRQDCTCHWVLQTWKRSKL